MFAEKVLSILREYVETVHNGTVLHASKALGIPNDTLDRWLKGSRDPGLSKIGPVMDKILCSHVMPNKNGALEIKYHGERSDEDCIQSECDELRKELAKAYVHIDELKNKLIACEAVRDSFDAIIREQLSIVASMPNKVRQDKSCAS